MGEKVGDCIGDVDISNSEITFENLVILKEFGNIVNLVSNEDFLELVPKAKLRVKWVPMFNCLKQAIYEEMVKEFSTMWKFENMSEKLEILDKQKEKFNELYESNITLWRPQVGDVKSQLVASDTVNLKKQKLLLEAQAKEYEARVNKLKKIIMAKRGYIKAMQMDIQKYQKKNEEFIFNMNNKFEDHRNLTKLMSSKQIDVEELSWTEKRLE
ncbi:hypothetical protein K1T71_008280 [Dendrolimus kikuchii]|uniref:Uncharacterized protein n=1 Tax=Dendrolimus kikuchii TaxID=765133 RepID=A0ACC1CWZ5_9NEOP|nr:hypothetical protein K1T71_008280 [Dendrolimus kikuchii]